LWERKAHRLDADPPGPNRVGPAKGLLTPIADARQADLQGDHLPSAASKGIFFLGPIMTIMPALAAWAVIPFGPEVALANVNAGLLFLMADDVARGVRRHHRRLVEQLEVRLPGGHARLGADGVLRDRHGLRAGGGADGQWLDEHERHRRQAEVGHFAAMGLGFLSWNWLPLFPIFRRLLHLGPGGNQPPPLRRGGGRVGDRRRTHDRVLGHELRHVLPGRIRQHDPGVGPDRAAVPRGLVGARSWSLFGMETPAFVQQTLPLWNWFWLFAKTFVVVTMFLWVRASFPRFRYDQIMRLGWKIFIPVTLVWLVVVCGCDPLQHL
jgi:NADH-quinone oxidoreductase subunit H